MKIDNDLVKLKSRLEDLYNVTVFEINYNKGRYFVYCSYMPLNKTEVYTLDASCGSKAALQSMVGRWAAGIEQDVNNVKIVETNT